MLLLMIGDVPTPHHQVQDHLQDPSVHRHHAYRRSTDPGEMQSMQLPSHWDPMRAREDCRLADICMRPGEEYNGDLEGWEVERLSLVFMCFDVSLCVTGLQVALQTSSLPSTSKHYCLFLWQGYVMHCCAEFIWYQCRPCTTSSYTPHERWA